MRQYDVLKLSFCGFSVCTDVDSHADRIRQTVDKADPVMNIMCSALLVDFILGVIFQYVIPNDRFGITLFNFRQF